jgi:hypothetical protein
MEINFSALAQNVWQNITLDRILASLAIGFATRQYFDAKSTRQEMVDIGESMSTRFIGAFPDNMGEIKNIVEDAETQLDIMVDYVGYGHFSSPAIFRAYLAKIHEKYHAGVKIRLIAYGENLLTQSNASEFPTEQFEKLKGSVEWKDFFNIHCKGQTEPSSYHEFRDLMIQRQRLYLSEARFAGIDIRTVSQELVFFVWLEDGEDAVFSFRGAGLNSDREVSFRTRDGKLIETFSGLFEKIWKGAAPVCDPCKVIPGQTLSISANHEKAPVAESHAP